MTLSLRSLKVFGQLFYKCAQLNLQISIMIFCFLSKVISPENWEQPYNTRRNFWEKIDFLLHRLT